MYGFPKEIGERMLIMAFWGAYRFFGWDDWLIIPSVVSDSSRFTISIHIIPETNLVLVVIRPWIFLRHPRSNKRWLV